MKYKVYFAIIAIITFLLLIIIPNFSNGTTYDRNSILSDNGTDPETVITHDTLINPDEYKPGNANSDKLYNIGKTILAVINIIGVVVSVVALGIIGLRYMFGSIEERAQYKETMWPYILGLVMLGGIPTILNIIYSIASDI